MTVETQVGQSRFQSAPGDGIHEVVMGAARAIMGTDLDSPGLLQIHPADQTAGSPLWVAIEATFADAVATRTIAKLDVRVRHVGEMPLGVVRDGLAELGGLAFTNVCFGPAGNPAAAKAGAEVPREDVLDVTVSFPSRFPFLASNVALFGDRLGAADRELCRTVLSRLGVRFTETGGEIRVRAWQLRGRMDPSAQLGAFEAAMGDGRRASIYSAMLPPSSSVRVERGVSLGEGTEQAYVDVCLSRGLTAQEATTAAQTQAMQELLERHLGVGFGGREYQVASCRWTMPPPPEPKPTGGLKLPWR